MLQKWLSRTALLFLFAASTAALAVAPGPVNVRVDDWDNDGVEDCNGFDNNDDTSCWQSALDTARGPDAGVPQFGNLVATSGAHYIISDTLQVTRSFGGVISGQGATLEWRGTSTSIPMFLLEDTQLMEIRDLRIEAWPGKPLKAAFELTNAPNDPCQYCNVAPKNNVIDHVFIDGIDTFALEYGVMFTVRHGIDQDNDQTTIMNSSIAGVMKAAVSIEGFNSVQHRFIALNAYGAGNNGNYDNDDVSPVTSQHLKGASYVRLKHGSFVSISGFHGGMRNAEYYIEDAGMGVTIIDSSSEGSAHFLKSIDGNAAYTISVTVMGSRFAIEESVVGGVPQHDGLAADGRIIDWQRYGPLTINGLVVDGVKPSNVTGDPHFYINPASPIVGDHQPMHYDVSNVSVKAVGSSAWELFQINADTRLTTHGNVCFDTTPKGVPCTGLAAGTNDAIETAKNKNLSDASNTFPAGLTRDTEWDTAAEINAATTDDDLATLNGSQTVKNKTFDATNAFPSGLTSDSEWDTAAEINAATTDDDLATLNGTQTLKNKTFTDASNVFSATASVGFTVVAPGTGTKYCGPNSSVNDTTEANVSLRLPRGTLSNLYCKATVGPGTSGKTWRATIWKNASATTAFCDLTGNAAAATCTDSTHTVSIAAGDLVSIEVKKQAGSGSFNAANVGCTIDEKP